jgi:hypothetical protein
MTYLKKLKQNHRVYLYIMRSERRGKKVIPKVLEYLGRDPHPARLKKALVYWGVKEKPEKGKGR